MTITEASYYQNILGIIVAGESLRIRQITEINEREYYTLIGSAAVGAFYSGDL